MRPTIIGSAFGIAAIVLAACAPTVSTGGSPTGGAEAPAVVPEASAPKVLTLGIQTELKGFLIDYTQETVRIGGISQPIQVVHNFLVVNNGMDVWFPQLAMEAPSIERGTWVLQPDGGMEVTWKLHSGVKWHDGTPFTA